MALSTVQAQPRILPYSDGTDYKWYSSPCFIWCTEKREISNKPKNRADAKGGSQHEPFVLLHQKEPIKPRFKSTSSLHSTVIPVICLSDFQSNHRLLVIAKEFFLLESQTSANPSVTPVAQWLKWSDQVWAFLHSSSSRHGAVEWAGTVFWLVYLRLNTFGYGGHLMLSWEPNSWAAHRVKGFLRELLDPNWLLHWRPQENGLQIHSTG